jgi:hypothetical protein
MRKFGYVPFIVGFVWVLFIALEVGPAARALRIHHRETVSEQHSYTREDIETAYGEAAYRIAHFAQWSLAGCFLIFVGGIILLRSGKRNSAVGKPLVYERPAA